MRRSRFNVRPSSGERSPASTSASSSGEQLPLARAAVLQLDPALGEALGPDQHLIWSGSADQVHGRELGARPLVAVVVEDIDAGLGERPCRCVSQAASVSGVADLQVGDADRRKGATASGQIDAVASSWPASISAATTRDGPMPYEPMWTGTARAVRPVDDGLHGLRIFGAEVEDVARPRCRARRRGASGDQCVEGRRVELLAGRGVERDVQCRSTTPAGPRRRRSRCRPAAARKREIVACGRTPRSRRSRPG